MRPASSRLRIVVTGLVAEHPRLGGVAWDHLQYALGLVQLGHDVTYLEDSGSCATGPGAAHGGAPEPARDPRPSVAHLAKLMERFGLAERWAYRFPPTGAWFGLSDAARREATRDADLLIDVSGALAAPEEHRGRGRLAYIDTDPVFTQLRLAGGAPELAARVAAHDVHFSFGERVPRLDIPMAQRWRPTRQPVVLAEWQPGLPARRVYTTVLAWTSQAPIALQGVSYGPKEVELRRFLELPDCVAPLALEIALGGTRRGDGEGGARGRPPRAMLRHAGFRVVDAQHTCADLDRYRHYVETSRGEWSVQKNGTVRGQPGCLSARSACYLAAGRPVVVQDTGLADVLPTGDGLLAFDTPEAAAAALLEVEADYERHAEAARALAAACFDAELVLPALLEEALA